MFEDIIYPLTVLNDRYGGVYSGGEWTAFNLNPEDIPSGPHDQDIPCAEFWGETDLIVGFGDTPDAAIDDLKKRLSASV